MLAHGAIIKSPPLRAGRHSRTPCPSPTPLIARSRSHAGCRSLTPPAPPPPIPPIPGPPSPQNVRRNVTAPPAVPGPLVINFLPIQDSANATANISITNVTTNRRASGPMRGCRAGWLQPSWAVNGGAASPQRARQARAPGTQAPVRRRRLYLRRRHSLSHRLPAQESCACAPTLAMRGLPRVTTAYVRMPPCPPLLRAPTSLFDRAPVKCRKCQIVAGVDDCRCLPGARAATAPGCRPAAACRLPACACTPHHMHSCCHRTPMQM